MSTGKRIGRVQNDNVYYEAAKYCVHTYIDIGVPLRILTSLPSKI